jgi:hypothetical protein
MRPVAALGSAVCVVALVALYAGCTPAPPPAAAPVPVAPAVPKPAAPAAPAAARPLPVFVDVAKQAGLVAMNHTGKPVQKDWIVSGMGGGAIVLDYDRDGLMDLVVVDGTMLTEAGDLEFNDDWRTRVYHNDGNLKFTDVTAKSGVDVKAFGFGGASCDYDADGWPDFYICCWGRSYLLRNRGDGTFEEVAAKAGLLGADDDMSTGCCWGDVDGDGVQDLYVSNYADQHAFIKECREAGRPGRYAMWRSFPVYVGPGGLKGQLDRLYLGNGDGTFREATTANLGPQEPVGYGFQPIMSDVDNDGDLDIYVPNDTQKNYLWINDGKGHFIDRGVEAGAAYDFDGKTQASMGVDFADVNRDGWLDLAVSNFSHDHFTLYVNQSGKTRNASFQDMSNAYNVTRPSFLRLQWGNRLFDFDCDGNLDLFVACGHVYGEIDNFQKATGSSYRQRCLLLRGVGPPTNAFENVGDLKDGENPADPAIVAKRGGPAMQLMRVWRGAAFADFDNDGDLDVFVGALNDYPALFRNDGGNRNSFLVFRLVGKGGLRDPSGARVTVFLADGKPRVEELHHGASFSNDNDPRLFFGLGAETEAKRVEVRWPGGATQSFEHVAARKEYLVEQGVSELKEVTR